MQSVGIVALAAGLFASAAQAAPEAKTDPLRLRYCGLMRGCGLAAPQGWCTPELSGGVDGVKYDEARCAEARELTARGVRNDDLEGYRLFAFLGHRYRVLYAVEGEVPVSAARLTYLMNDLPLAARLLTRFQSTAYAAEYVDPQRRRFRGSKGSKLTGEADLIAGSPDVRTLWYFGEGTSKVGPWRLRGRSLMRFEFFAAGSDGKRVGYRVRIVSTPTNAMLNAIMNLGLFKSIVNGEIREMVEDVTQASGRLEAVGATALGAEAQWSPEDREKLAALLRLP
jgi:hypothetical protein